jgi:hypothetical protein
MHSEKFRKCTFHQILLDHKIKEDEMGSTYSTHDSDAKCAHSYKSKT